MEIVAIILLVILAIFLVVVETLLLPGVTFAAIGAAAAGLYATYITYEAYGFPAAMFVLTISLILAAITVFICIRSRSVSKITLKTKVDSTVMPNIRDVVKVGDSGVTVTRLAPMGTVRIGEHSVEAKSTNGLIDPKTEIIVIGYEDNGVIVTRN